MQASQQNKRSLGLTTPCEKFPPEPKRTFTEKLIAKMEKCKDTHSSSCQESYQYTDGRGNIKYSNCEDSALAIYTHTTGTSCDEEKCCTETGDSLRKKDQKYLKGIEEFNYAILKDVTKDSMCLVTMKLSEKFFHTFTLEVRMARDGRTEAFYVFSSWSNYFTLKWFLALAPCDDMRSGMTELKSTTERKALWDVVSPVAKTLRTKCGSEQFLLFNEANLTKCINSFLDVLNGLVNHLYKNNPKDLEDKKTKF